MWGIKSGEEPEQKPIEMQLVYLESRSYYDFLLVWLRGEEEEEDAGVTKDCANLIRVGDDR